MIDIRAARNDPDAFRKALARKGAAELFDELLAADEAVRAVQQPVEDLRSQRKPKGKPSPEEIEQLNRVKAELQQLEEQLATAEARRKELLDRIPNPPAEDTPDGFTDEDAVEIARVGEPPAFDFPAKDHLDLAQAHGWIDIERAAKVSGSRFAYRIGDVALLELSLYRYALDRLVQQGFVPVLPPVLVREDAMYGTGFLPTDEVNIYKVERDELYLTGTAEVGLAAMHMGEILDADSLPLRYAGYSTNFRREAGAAGKDTRGMFRVHQFDKVEMYVFTTMDAARDEHERLLEIEMKLIADLDIPFPRRQRRRGRPRRVGRQEVRHRGLVPGPGALSRADVDVEHDRLPSAAARRAHAARRQARARRDAERHGCDRAHDDRAAGELPGRGRLGLDPGAALGIRRAAKLGGVTSPA